ncbi:hypothetical protein MVEN_00468200 [Mycena venus]|uniref:Uncharacterized protein n=1 Tax=Mycena venus TaxID=2733690 RepID=A0A8H6YY25_9AGAR|nr:hypothetical protein MVEN_00468200 [Mycena venus]
MLDVSTFIIVQPHVNERTGGLTATVTHVQHDFHPPQRTGSNSDCACGWIHSCVDASRLHCGKSNNIRGIFRIATDLTRRFTFTTFNYSNGPAVITVSVTELEDPKWHAYEWMDSIARANRSDTRMALHVVFSRTGRVVCGFLVPLRKSNSNADKLLQQVADSEVDVASFEFATRYQTEFENLDSDIVETY